MLQMMWVLREARSGCPIWEAWANNCLAISLSSVGVFPSTGVVEDDCVSGLVTEVLWRGNSL